jgi:HK97 family phage major capsid protein
MIQLTKSMKQWSIANCKGLDDQSSDDSFRKAVGMALATGDMTMEKYAQLAQDDDADDASEFGRQLKALGDGIGQLTKMLSQKPEEKKVETKAEEEVETKETKPKATKAEQPAWHKSIKRMMNVEPPVDDDGNIRVKGAWEAYSTTKSAKMFPMVNEKGRPHPLAGKPVMDFSEGGRQIDESSELDKAVAGAFCKLLVSTAQKGGSRTFGFQSLPQHDKELLHYAMEKMTWAGSTDGGDYADIKNRLLSPREQKALIDDATSGGLEAAPIVFDDQVIQAPLLNGELFPLVNQVPIDRGRRIEGVATGTVTGSWGGVDDTAVSLFTTTSYVTAFDTTIFRWEGSIRIGLDFLSDTPIDFGQHVTQQYGERLLEDLDDVIATGNGTTQPEGIINKAGATSVAFGGATSIGNYESLRFGVHKREHKGTFGGSAVFCGTETSYSRVKALPVGASDARRLFNNQFPVSGYDGYQLMERPYKINESLTNAQIFYAIMGRYRMYRRRGLTMRTSQEGDTLLRNNELLMVAMARYGGQMERGATIARTTTAPA